MRFAMLLLLAPVLHAQSAVDGQVLNSVSGAGIEGVQVELEPAGDTGTAYRTVTDSAGEFSVTVNEGTYKVRYKKPGFAATEYDPRNSITVTKTAPLHLWRGLDPLTTLRGRTLPNITVELLSARGQIQMTTAANAEGDFRFPELTPGAYILRANPNRAAQTAAELPGGEGPRVMLAPSYYPGVPDRAQASVIHVAGGELSGYDIPVRPGPVFRIAGRLLDVQGKPLPKVSVELVSADAWNIDSSVFDPARKAAREKERALVSSGEDGTFEFANISPGNWHLVAGTPLGMLAVLPVTVTRHDLENLTLRMAKLFSLSVTFEGLTEQTPQVHLVPVSGAPHHEVYSGRVPEGEREKKVSVDLYPDRYRFNMGNRVGHYLAAILLGDRNVLGEEVELAEGALPVRMVYKPDGGRVTGTVEKGGFARVVLASRNPGLRFQWEVMRCDAEGRFEVGSLRPGDYLAVAVRHASVSEDPLWMATLEQRAASVHVDANQTTTISLRVQ